MKKLLFVFNPHAGKGQIKDNLCDIVDIFTKGGYEVSHTLRRLSLTAITSFASAVRIMT